MAGAVLLHYCPLKILAGTVLLHSRIGPIFGRSRGRIFKSVQAMPAPRVKGVVVSSSGGSSSSSSSTVEGAGLPGIVQKSDLSGSAKELSLPVFSKGSSAKVLRLPS